MNPEDRDELLSELSDLKKDNYWMRQMLERIYEEIPFKWLEENVAGVVGDDAADIYDELDLMFGD